ncbi:hypothetical protein [Paraburkholderia caffeinilytica]|uniref:hypothetical protein n=1 Tax=Paraburkholderia caffeinilytica TaxID=1761016 RepID=UPI003DA1A938
MSWPAAGFFCLVGDGFFLLRRDCLGACGVGLSLVLWSARRFLVWLPTVLGFGFWFLVFGFWFLVFGFWFLVFGLSLFCYWFISVAPVRGRHLLFFACCKEK